MPDPRSQIGYNLEAIYFYDFLLRPSCRSINELIILVLVVEQSNW